MIRLLLAASVTALFVSCAPAKPDIEGQRTAWAKKDEKAEKTSQPDQAERTDDQNLVKSGEYQPNWQF